MTWRTARSLDTAVNQLNQLAPHRSKISDGSIGDTTHSSRESDHNPDEYDIVRARDYTHDPINGADMNKFAYALMTDERTKYVIWDDEFYDRDSTGRIRVRPYIEVNPIRQNLHKHHLHHSVVSDRRADSTALWGAFRSGTQAPQPSVNQEDEMFLLIQNIQTGTLGLFGPGFAEQIKTAEDHAALKGAGIKEVRISNDLFDRMVKNIRLVGVNVDAIRADLADEEPAKLPPRIV
jgi:hypothetical protein